MSYSIELKTRLEVTNESFSRGGTDLSEEVTIFESRLHRTGNIWKSEVRSAYKINEDEIIIPWG